MTPTPDDSFQEDYPPSPAGLVPIKVERPTITDLTRRYIAFGLLVLLGLLIGGTLVSFIVGWLTTEEMKETGVLITPVFTLAGTALGFYFGANKD